MARPPSVVTVRGTHPAATPGGTGTSSRLSETTMGRVGTEPKSTWEAVASWSTLMVIAFLPAVGPALGAMGAGVAAGVVDERFGVAGAARSGDGGRSDTYSGRGDHDDLVGRDDGGGGAEPDRGGS